ncbi:MAG: nucleotidyltransferase domain-containing protein [Hydrogenophaga sp.]|uniref:nucleotidyltransferase domain-containing protein n=1 Tax=Hydrogenophaga sp. TaxID=1904254 RepID=UPI0027204311|nr:nucleotidyltransferase domain-containing protein [Hydrogenophaga sp.]MDO9605223.1 nucleotidyltransferase domain-containing protein [Hydrogenophaga sp.]MDP2163538.1 nucleotidyltransferase domain-containing protein [Hydrogenophaga sp.]MDP3474841.1 nucleotidyltransferase domain-containing protein [Hydrogenophaga sp.]
MLGEILFPLQYRRRLLAVLCMRTGQWFHLRELERLTSAASVGSLKKELDLLAGVGLLNIRKVGNQTQFCVNEDHPVYPELMGLVRKSIGLVDVVHAALAPWTQQISVAFVYGSMAQGTDTPHSDVDVMILGDVSFANAVNALYDCQATLGREINPKLMTLVEWQTRKAAGDSFVQDVLNKPKLFILGGPNEL